jgi:hypothetical protein
MAIEIAPRWRGDHMQMWATDNCPTTAKTANIAIYRSETIITKLIRYVVSN